MRILQVVTLVSSKGAYGGPTRVALNQSRALQDRGHAVTVVAGSLEGINAHPREAGISVNLFPARHVVPRAGFAGLTSPSLHRWMHSTRHLFDIVHIHLARDLITLPAARMSELAGLPVIAQTHGMIDPSERILARPLDAVLTRPALRAANAVLCLTQREAQELCQVAGPLPNLEELPNGVPLVKQNFASHPTREVLFLARLHRRKRPLVFAEAALRLHQHFPEVVFRLVGPDEGEGRSLMEFISENSASGFLQWEGPLSPDETLERVAEAEVYVLPSVQEPYPMSVLEAMSVGLPVVVTTTCGLAPHVQHHKAGLVVDDSVEALADAIRQLLADDVLRHSMGQNARSTARTVFAMETVAEQLENIYAAALKVGTNSDGDRTT